MKIATNQDRLNELFDSDARTDTAIAAELNVSKQAISAWRNGTRSPKKTILVRIAEMYHVSIEWLMGFDVEKNPADYRSIVIPDSELFKRIIVHMSREDYNTFMEILERTEKKMKKSGLL